jgi:hypothetical protein
MASSWMLRRVALVRTDVSEELSASIIRVTRFGELGTTLAVTSNRNSSSLPRLLLADKGLQLQELSADVTPNVLNLHSKAQPVNAV